MSLFSTSRIQEVAIFSAVALLVLVAFVPAFVTRANDCTDAGYEWYPDAYGGTCGDSGGTGSPVVLTMTANPESIQQGSSSTLSWGWDRDLSNPGSFECSIDNGVGAVEVIGSRVVTPAATTNYTITCTYSYYSYEPMTMDFVSSATVTVTPASVPPVTATLTATPGSVASGGSSTLTWSSTNAVSCNGNGFSTGGAPSGSVTVSSITSTTNYSVTCMGAGGGSGTGTWQYRESDTSDFACPLTDPNRAYSSTPNCPVSPAGKACNPSSGTVCKVNTIRNSGGCYIDTDLYNCVGGSATPAPTATAYATVNVTSACTLPGSTATGSQQTAQNTWFTGGTLGPQIATIDESCVPQCLAAGNAYCNELQVHYMGAEPRIEYKCNGVANPTGTQPYPVEESPEFITTRIRNAHSSSCTIPTAGPNLNAGSITPTTATLGAAVTLSSVISNTGTASSGAGFTNLFQIDSDNAHTAVTATRTDSSPITIASGSDTTTASYTFPTAGTWYVRACADNNASFAGVIAESDESDNCGPWTPINVTTGTSGVTSCTVSPSSITVDNSVTWTASPGDLGTYTWTPSEGGSAGGTGSKLTRTYSTQGTYGMSVTAGGVTRACPNITVSPNVVSCGTPNPTITASPDRVTSGSTSTLTVSASGVDTTCTVRNVNTNTVLQTLTATSCNVPTTTISTGSLTTQTTFSVTCGTVTDEVVVNVIPNFDEF